MLCSAVFEEYTTDKQTRDVDDIEWSGPRGMARALGSAHGDELFKTSSLKLVARDDAVPFFSNLLICLPARDRG
jgi:hypothetical protein